LMFKGSKNFPPKNGQGVLDAFEKKGAVVNASTWLDRTNYYEVVPKEHFEACVAVEADRMRHARITKKDLQEELPAVVSEYAMHKNNAREILDEHMWHTAFLAHGYHHSTIGWLSDIENASAETLQHFYDTYYHPNNAVVTIVGDITSSEALGVVKKYLGVHPSSPMPIPEPHTTEPEQLGERSFVIERSQGTNMLGMAWKVPPANHTDTPVLTLLAELLAGSESSLLHHALIEKGLCSSVTVDYAPFHDASLFMVYAKVLPKVTHATVQRRIEGVLRSVREKPLPKQLLQESCHAIERDMLTAVDGHYAFLSEINEYIATGDWTLRDRILKGVAKVTPEDIQKCVEKYVALRNTTTGILRITK